MKPVIAVIGAGKIGGALATALTKCGYTIVATGRREGTLENMKRLGVKAIRDNRRAVSEADMVLLSVKPVNVPQVLPEIGGELEGKALVSVVAGLRIKTLTEATKAAEVYRAMPNINVIIRRSTTALSGPRDGSFSRDVEEVFKCVGTVYWVPEEWLDPWTALVGSAPAYLSILIDALILGGVAVGLPRDVSTNAVLDTIEATVGLLRQRPVHPAEVRDEVTTPGGTTIEALKVIEERSVKAALIKTVEAATEKARLLGAEIDRQIRQRLGLS
ncbi:MAG: pyrroline-5-carboxylate reductase [Desulfurococcales archaeon]|nr:pyrroline-5-carboxylate reductase [Desulfurococcales archaeon]